MKKADGWFFHALTGHPWLVELKFHAARNTFKVAVLNASLGLPPLDEMHDLPVYSHQPRVECENLRGPWQEVRLRVHKLDEIDTPAFWAFVEQAAASFLKQLVKTDENPEAAMPWKALGEKWHLARKGFPPGKKVYWELPVLEQLRDLLGAVAPKAEFEWTEQQVVYVRLPGRAEPWARLFTKRAGGLDLFLTAPSGLFSLGRLAQLGFDRQVEPQPQRDLLKLRFRTSGDLARGDLAVFLREHLEAALARPVASGQ